MTGLAAGIGWVAKKAIEEPMTSDPISNVMNYVKFTVMIASSIVAKNSILKMKRFYHLENVQLIYNESS